MNKQMCWLYDQKNRDVMILHLRESAYQSWQPYSAYDKYSVPDYRIPGGSKGWATFQHLRRLNWQLIPTSKAKNHFIVSNYQLNKAA